MFIACSDEFRGPQTSPRKNSPEQVRKRLLGREEKKGEEKNRRRADVLGTCKWAHYSAHLRHRHLIREQQTGECQKEPHAAEIEPGHITMAAASADRLVLFAILLPIPGTAGRSQWLQLSAMGCYCDVLAD